MFWNLQKNFFNFKVVQLVDGANLASFESASSVRLKQGPSLVFMERHNARSLTTPFKRVQS